MDVHLRAGVLGAEEAENAERAERAEKVRSMVGGEAAPQKWRAMAWAPELAIAAR